MALGSVLAHLPFSSSEVPTSAPPSENPVTFAHFIQSLDLSTCPVLEDVWMDGCGGLSEPAGGLSILGGQV